MEENIQQKPNQPSRRDWQNRLISSYPPVEIAAQIKAITDGDNWAKICSYFDARKQNELAELLTKHDELAKLNTELLFQIEQIKAQLEAEQLQKAELIERYDAISRKSIAIREPLMDILRVSAETNKTTVDALINKLLVDYNIKQPCEISYKVLPKSTIRKILEKYKS